MKSKQKQLAATIALILSLPLSAHAIEVLETFDNVDNLTNRFTSDATPAFSAAVDGGIGDTGSVTVPIGSQDVWTTKTAYSMSGAGDSYEISAFFKVEANNGYGGLGLAVNDTNEPLARGAVASGLGVSFHGGGGSFENNGVATNLTWTNGLVLGNWYKFVYTLTRTAQDTFDLEIEITNSDADGTLGSVASTHTLSDVVNTDMAAADRIYVYFSSYGSRMTKIDNFTMTLAGSAGIISPAGAPAFTSQPVTSIAADSAYSYSITATDVDSADTLAISAMTLPSWLTLTDNGDGTGSLTGTPSASDLAGSNDVNLKVTDSVFDTFQQFTISEVEPTIDTDTDTDTGSGSGSGAFGLGLGLLLMPAYMLRRRLMK